MLADGCPELVGYRISEAVAEQVAGGAQRVIPARPGGSDVVCGDSRRGVEEAEDQREPAEVVGGSAADRCDVADVLGEQGRSRGLVELDGFVVEEHLSAPLLVVTATAWAVSGGVALHGYLSGEHPGLFAGLAAIGWIGIAGVLRMVGALGEARTAYLRLDEAHFALEQAQAQRESDIAELARRNVVLSAIQTMLGPLLEIANERTDGMLRSNLEATAHDLADWLPLERRD